MGHATLSPSDSARWMTCAGSIALSQNLPDKSNDAADHGTCYHFLAAECLTFGLNAAQYIGKTIVVWEHAESDSDGADILADFEKMAECDERYRTTVDTDGAAHLQTYLDYVRTVGHQNRVFVEVAVPIGHLTGEDGAEGTSDCVVINEAQRELAVIDLKFGYNDVQPDGPQMKIYALGVLEKMPEETAHLDKVRLTICQPRGGDGRPKEWTCTRADLEEFGRKVKRASTSVWAALDLYNQVKDAGNADVMEQWCDANLLVTEKGCQWCRAKARCPKIAKEVAQVTSAEFENLDQVELPVLVDDNSDLALKMLKCDLIEGWIKAVRAEVESELVAGREVPQYKLVQGRKGNRAWTTEAEAVALLKKMRLRVEEMYDFSLKSPTQITKFLDKTPKRLAKVLPLIHQPDGKISVAHESDKREAINLAPDASGMVAEVELVEDLV